MLSLPETAGDQFWYEEVEGGIKIVTCLVKDDRNGIVVIPNQIDGNITFDDKEFITISNEPKDITFVAPAGSNVEQYAKDNGFKFETLD